MKPEHLNQEVVQTDQLSRLHQVTPLSKYLAMALSIALPFVGGYVGYTFAPEKVVEVDRVIIQEVKVRDNLFEAHSFSRDTLTLIEAPELHKAGAYTSWSTSYHLFHDDAHVISVPGDCRKIEPPGLTGFREVLDFEERNEYEVLSHVVCNQSGTWFGAETLLLSKIHPAGHRRKVIHYNFRDCAMSGNDCESYGSPITLRAIMYPR